VAQAIRALQNHPAIAHAQPNWFYTHQDVSDEYYTSGYLWGMYGATTVPANANGSGAGAVWATGWVGSKSVYVGVIDEGIQYYHRDLDANMWVNPGEVFDGADNDGNGYVDDVYGWNALGDNGVVFDPAGDIHGTHVAGTIGAEANGQGVVGVNWELNLISGKFLGPNGGSTTDAIQAFDYFTSLKTTKGLNVVALNNSWGGAGYDALLLEAIVRAANAGILCVAVAGNGNAAGRAINTDTTPFYPACYNTTAGAGYDAVVSVTAIASDGSRPRFANYGLTTVDLGAPGVSIYSTVPLDAYASYSGTSMATPHVTGAIALYAARYPGTAAKDIKAALLASTTPTASLASKTVTGGRLDLVKFLATPPPGWVDPNPTERPAAPSELIATAISHTQIELTWQDNSNDETGFRITRNDGAVITVAANITTYTDSGLTPATTYTYSVQACAFTQCSEPTGPVEATTEPAPPASTAVFVGVDDTTKGNWQGVYGGEGYHILAGISDIDYTEVLQYVDTRVATVTPLGAGTCNWATSTTDERALVMPVAVPYRSAACYWEWTTFSLRVAFADTEEHRVALYCVDWDTATYDRTQRIDVIDSNYGTVLSSYSLDGFSNGKYVVWNVQGPVTFKFTYTGPSSANAVVSGVFFDVPAILPPPPAIPAAPSGLVATAVSTSQINLHWNDNSSDETSFEIERSTLATSGFVKIATVGPNVTAFSNTGLSKNRKYYYRVRATGTEGNSDYSNTASATTFKR